MLGLQVGSWDCCEGFEWNGTVRFLVCEMVVWYLRRYNFMVESGIMTLLGVKMHGCNDCP